MTSPSMQPLETALVDLFQQGVDRAHFAAGQLVPTDWIGLAARDPERIASLTLVSPRVRRPELEFSWSPVDGARRRYRPKRARLRQIDGRADAGAIARAARL